jgi:hypothetical protein
MNATSGVGEKHYMDEIDEISQKINFLVMMFYRN